MLCNSIQYCYKSLLYPKPDVVVVAIESLITHNTKSKLRYINIYKIDQFCITAILLDRIVNAK